MACGIMTREHFGEASMVNISELAGRLLSLEGKVALVTGAASGIGRGIALRLAGMGAATVLFDIDGAKGEAVAAEIACQGAASHFVCGDVRSSEDCKRSVGETIQKFRRIDILCNNAGVVIRKSVDATSEEEWDRAIDVTMKSVFLLSREVIPHMIRSGGGVIINTGSGWGLKGGAMAASYCGAKGGVVNLTRAMAIDYGKHNIRVNCVCPGDVDTPMLRSECAQLGTSPDAFMKEAAARPIARIGTPEDVANAVLFLASPMSAWVTGATLVVDGGGLA
jgi:NAD(P)-dependent dehydrogenase (short-subunit alcohol dehydrogenase family)